MNISKLSALTNNIAFMASVKSSMFAVLLAMLSITNVAQAQVDCDEVENLVLGCNGSINVALNADCSAHITLEMVLAGTPWTNPAYPSLDFNDFQLTILNNGVAYPRVSSSLTILGIDEVGLQLEAMISIPTCGISCWGYLNLEDKSSMILDNCGDYTISCAEFEEGNSQTINRPNVDSACSLDPDDITFEYSDDTLAINCTLGYATTISRTWNALDEDGEIITSCTQNIFVNKMDLADVEFPDDYIQTVTNSLDCSIFDNQDPEVTGYPTGIRCPNIQYFYTDNNGFDMCGASIKMLREWTVIDWCTGGFVEGSQIIKILDLEPPVTVCPVDQLDTLFLATSSNICEADINLDPLNLAHGFGAFALLEDCSGIVITVEYRQAIPGTDIPDESEDFTSLGIVEEADGTYSLPPVPEGVVWIRYGVEDECGNRPVLDPTVGTDDANSCRFEIRVMDTLPPNPICEGFTKVQLDDNGHVEVFAETFDDHSYDVCEEQFMFLVRRLDGTCAGYEDDAEYHLEDGIDDLDEALVIDANNDGIFDGEWNQDTISSVNFCCEDLGDTITVMLMVIDRSGRYAECLATVCVSDDGSTYDIDCPADSTVVCGTDYEAIEFDDIMYSSTGICGEGPAEVVDVKFNESLNDCGIGVVRRTVTVELPNGSTRFCTHRIFVRQELPINYDSIVIDSVLSIDGCDYSANSIDPSIIGGIPYFLIDVPCSNIHISHEDQVLTLNPSTDACLKVKRTWTLVDWCLYDETNGADGIWTRIQIIKVTDGESPEIVSSCEDVHVYADGDCQAQVHLEVTVDDNCTYGSDITTLLVTYNIDVYNDGDASNDINGTGTGLWEVLPSGYHTVTWTASDACGNVGDTCTQTVTVVGDDPPSAICLASIVWSLNPSGIATVWASDFDLKSEGGCGTDSELTFSFTHPDNGINQSIEFDCDDILNGVIANIQIEIWVIDQNGVYESCYATLILQDNHDVCEDAGYGRGIVQGKVITENNEGLMDTEVELHDMGESDMAMNMTANDGEYLFEDVVFNGNYMVSPKRDDDPLNGVTTLDMLNIQKHILGVKTLDSPYKMIAADVNRSENITSIDLVEIRKLILGIYDEFPHTDSWTFIYANHTFADPSQPWDFAEEHYLNEMYQDEMNIDFYGVKMGDVNGSVSVEGLVDGDVQLRSSDAIVLSYSDAQIVAGESISVPFVAEESYYLEGMQFTLNFDADKFEYKAIEGAKLALYDNNVGTNRVASGIITLSYDDYRGINIKKGATLFNVELIAKQSTNLSNAFSISSDITKAEAYGESDEILQIVLESQKDGNDIGQIKLFQNQPNPFGNETSIGFYLPNASEINFEILTTDGKVLYRVNDAFEKGHHNITIDASRFANKGVMLYKLESGNFTDTKKMILLN